jgi:hypothetical protein
VALDRAIHLREGDAAIDRGLAGAEEVEIRAVEDEDGGRDTTCHWRERIHRTPV